MLLSHPLPRWLSWLLLAVVLPGRVFPAGGGDEEWGKPPPRFDQLGTPTDVFPTDIVTRILEGRYGFMWFGTQRGLIRFDGSGIRVYRHDPDDPQSLSGEGIEALLEDRSGRFWVGTNNGLDLLDRVQGQATRFPNANNPRDAFIWSLAEGDEDSLWVGTGRSLYLLTISQGRWTPIQNGLPEGKGIRALLKDASGTLWVGMDGAGLWYRLAGQNRFKLSRLPGDLSVTSLAATPGRQDEIWAGTTDAGLFRLREDELKAFSSDKGTISHNGILAMNFDGDGHLWVGTENGLNGYRADAEGFSVYSQDNTHGDGLRSSRIHVLYGASHGLLWLGTSKGGVDRLNLNHRRFWFGSLPNAEVTSVLISAQGTLWIGTKRKGLLAYGPEGNRLGTYFTKHMIRALNEDPTGSLWVGSVSGLFRLQDGIETPVEGFDKRTVWALERDHRGDLWVGTAEGLFQLRGGKGEATHFQAQPESDKHLSSNVVVALEADGDKLWVGTYGGGLNLLDGQKGHFQHFLTEDGLSNPYVIHLHMAGDGRLWVATHGGGLNRFDPVTRQFERFTTREGFPDNSVTAINEDAHGRIWVSCGEGLVRLDPSEAQLNHVLYQIQHGLPDGGMLPGATARDPLSGIIYFGSVSGLTGLLPSGIPAPIQPQLAFTSVKKGGKEVAHLHMPNQTLTLTQKEKAFSLELAVLDFLTPQRHSTAYRRLGLDDDWEFAGGKSHVGYTKYFGYNLGGDYALQIKGTSGNGIWREGSLPLIIDPPWWRPWLPHFSAGGLLVLVMFTYALFLTIERRKRRKLREQARLAEERALLAEGREELEREARRLQEEHTALLQEHLEQVSTEIANDLHDGPLSQLHGLGFQLTGLGRAIDDASTRAGLEQISGELLPRVRDALRNLCGELLAPDFDQGLVVEIGSFLDATAAAYPELTIETHLTPAGEPAREVQALLFRIFRTLVKNVVKHASATRLRVCLQNHSGSLVLKVEDDGQGFCVPETWEIFKKNKHYGMYMAAYFAETAGGTLQVRSKPGEGTSVSVILPLQHEQLKEAAS